MKNLILLVSLLLISCNNDESGLTFNQNLYNQNKQLWDKSNIQNYTFTQENFTEGLGTQPKLVTVVKNSIMDTIFLQSKDSLNEQKQRYLYYKTIPELYHYIENTAESCKKRINNGSMKGAEIEVEYNNKFHYPTKVVCKGYYKKGFAGGLYTHITITEFKVQ